jgi:ATP/maltotriose-dependent transcriptional regulator MalT
MVSETNSLHNEVKTYKTENKMDKLAQALLNLGNKYFKSGDFKEASTYLNDLSAILSSSKGEIKYEQYATKLALSFYYLSQFYDLSRFNSKHI